MKNARFLVVSEGHIVSSKLHVEGEDFDGHTESRRRILWTLCVFSEYIKSNNLEYTGTACEQHLDNGFSVGDACCSVGTCTGSKS